MSKRVVSLLLTLLLALFVCIPAFATAVEPADQTDVSESAETEETAPAEEESIAEDSGEEAPTGQPETTESEEETETSSDITPEDPASTEEDQEDSDEIATIASGNEISVTYLGVGFEAPDMRALEFEGVKDFYGTDTDIGKTTPGSEFRLYVHHGYTLESVKGCTISVDDSFVPFIAFENFGKVYVKVDDDATEVQIRVVPTDMITIKLLGAPDKLEIEDEFGNPVSDGVEVPEHTGLKVVNGLNTGYIVEKSMEIYGSSGEAGGVVYGYSYNNNTQKDEPSVETSDYSLGAKDENGDGVVTFNIVKGVLVTLNDPYEGEGIYFNEDEFSFIPSVLHVGDYFIFMMKGGFSATVAGGKIEFREYEYDYKTGEPYRRCVVSAGAEDTLVINIEKTDEPIPTPKPHPSSSPSRKIQIKYDEVNKSAFIGNNPDEVSVSFGNQSFSVYVDKDYTVKAEGAKAYFDHYITSDFSTADDFNEAVGKEYHISIDDYNTVTQVTLHAVKGSHDVKLIVEGNKDALIKGSGLNQDGDILKEGRGKIRLRNGYSLERDRHDDSEYISRSDNEYDVFGGEIYMEYNVRVPTDIDTLKVEVFKVSPSRWIEVTINNPDQDNVSYSIDDLLNGSLLNDKGIYVFLYHAPEVFYGDDRLCEINIKKGYRPEAVGGMVSYERRSQNDKWMDVYSVTPDEKADKITITLKEGANVSVKLPSNAVGEDELYDTVMHLLDMADPGDPELERLRDLINNAVGKEVTAEVVMEEVSEPSGNIDASKFNGKFYYVDIHIDIKIDGKVVGTLGTTDKAIKFSQEYKEELGRIVVLVREHNGEAKYLPVQIEGDTLWFSSDMFSIFAIGYTNDINYAEVDDIPRQEYTGNPVEPEVVVTANGKPLTLGQDYTVAYENNIEEGVATAIITGINGFEGKKEVPFVIGNGELPSEPSKPSTKPTPTPTPKPDYGIIPDVPWYQYQPEDDGEYVPGPDEVTYSGFPDVDPNAWYAGPVGWAAQSGVTAGYPDGNFHPDDTCTRAQIVTFLWKAAGTPMSVGTVSFSDVEQGSFYYDAAVWAANSGIIAGYPDGNFHPDDPCTRAQIVAMLYRYANSPAVTGESKFFDVDAGAYYYNAAIWAEQNGIVAGYPDGGFHPNDACTRAQIVTMLYNYIKG